MNTFLSQVINDVLLNEKTPLVDIKFVLPSQRACVFLKKEIIQQLPSSSFLPQIISIENFIQELADINQIDNVQLLFEFYTIYLTQTPKEKQDSFDKFSQWATVVLQDFNEVDRNLIDAKDIFNYLKDINRLKNWSPTTKLSTQYFSFFEKLYTYYQNFYSHLLSQKKGYQGLIYREAESNLQYFIENNLDVKIILVGFNALNIAEELIFQELLENDLASIYWDADNSYFNNSNSTGQFVRKYKQEWNYYRTNEFKWNNDFLSNTISKKINIISTNKNVNQIKYAGELISGLSTHQNTAMILSDESLLSLTLNSLPNNVEKINITMGYPLSDIPLGELFKILFKLYINQEKLDTDSQQRFYYKEVLNLFENNYFLKLIDHENHNLREYIEKNNYIFITQNQLVKICQKLEITFADFLFFENASLPFTFIENCIKICNELKDKYEGLEKEYIYHFYKIFQQLKTLNDKYKYLKDLKTLHQFFLQLLSNQNLSFQGEPLEGLQLMGMLETRVIDFETVILTSVNEGILPASKSEKSFIPFDVKKQFGLPTYYEKDAIFSYHFFRLLHRAKNIYLIYNNEATIYGTGEKSRFISQLELMRNDIKHQILIPKINLKPSIEKQVIKTSSLLLELKKIAKKGISPSALATYVNNPIDFYYQKVLKVREIENVEETVGVNTMGTIIHETLEELYKPFLGQVLIKENILEMLKNYKTIVESSFKKVYANGAIDKGKNKLVYEVSKNYVHRFLKMELNEINDGREIKIIVLEKELKTEITIEKLDFPLIIHGIIDRIDQVDGITRIIDYKTGKVEQHQLNISDFSLLSQDYKYSKALQILLYSYLYSQENSTDLLEAGIISFKNLNKGFLKLNFAKGRVKNNQITNEIIDEFLVSLKGILNEIFDDNIPFTENSNKAF